MFCRIRSSRVGVKSLAALVALLVALLVLPTPAWADGYSIDEVNIDATISTDGSVSVLESREFDFNGSYHGVYWKIPTGSYEGRQIETTITTVGEIIDGQLVAFEESYSGEDHTYQLSEGYDYVQVKLYSAHSYENATFVIGYTDTDLAARHGDVSELYWKFVSDGWDVESENVTCVVHLPVPDGATVTPEENVRAWGHGPLDATVSFDGNDVVYAVPGVGTSEFAEARITFPESWLSDATSQGGTVLPGILEEEQQWASEANSKRGRARAVLYGGTGISLVAAIAMILGGLGTLRSYRRTHVATFDDDYFRDVPSDDHPAVLGALWRGGSPDSQDLTASLMRLTDMGKVKLELVTLKKRTVLGREKTRQDYRLSLVDWVQVGERGVDEIDKRTQTFVFTDVGQYSSSHEPDGSDANAVYFEDFEKVAKKHPSRYDKAWDGWKAKVEAAVAQRRFFKEDAWTGRARAITFAVVAGVLVGVSPVALAIAGAPWYIIVSVVLLLVGALVVNIGVAVACKRVSKEALELKAKLTALRRWLKEFTRLNEAVPHDVVLWNRLLVMAVVLGVANDVIKQLKVAAPEILEDPMLSPTYGWYYGGSSRRPYESFHSAAQTAHSVSTAQLASSSSSSGGGGGGGFSGGGGGGFGGGGGGGAF